MYTILVFIILQKYGTEARSGDRYESMPPVTCNYATGVRTYNIDEGQFKLRMDQGLGKTKNTKFTNWGLPDLGRFCDKVLCSEGGPSIKNFDSVRKTFEDGSVVGDNRTLCIQYILTQRCKRQEREEHGGDLTLQCFLAQGKKQETIQSYLHGDVIEGLRTLKDEFYKRNKEKVDKNCAHHLNDDGTCDFAAAYETSRKKTRENQFRRDTFNYCQRYQDTPQAYIELQKLTGVIASFPKWFKRLKCEYDHKDPMKSYIAIKARKLRVHYLQSWFMRVEKDIFHKDRRWLKQAMQHHHHHNLFAKDSDSEINRIEDETLDWKKMVSNFEVGKDSKMTKTEAEIRNGKKIIENMRKEYLENTDYLDMTFRERGVTGFEYQLAARAAVNLRSRNAPTGLNFELTAAYLQPGLDKNALYDLEKNFLLPPETIGETHFRNYLFRPDQWEKSFWDMVTPENYHRLFATRTMTGAICQKLRISNVDFIAPASVVGAPYNSKYFTDHGTGENNSGACSVSYINTRLALVKMAAEEEALTLEEKVELNKEVSLQLLNEEAKSEINSLERGEAKIDNHGNVISSLFSFLFIL